MIRRSRQSSPLPVFLRVLGLLLVSAAGFGIGRQICRRGYQSFELTEESKERLLEAYPPKFRDVKASHITYQYGVSRLRPMPAIPQGIEVIGYISDESLECVIIAIAGDYRRPDGGIFHITLSKEPDREARESNDLIRKHGWVRRENDLHLQAIPNFRLI